MWLFQAREEAQGEEKAFFHLIFLVVVVAGESRSRLRRQRNVAVVLSRCFKFGDFPRRGLHGRRFGFFAGEAGNLGIFGVHSPLKSKLGKSRGGFSERERCEGMNVDFPGDKKTPKNLENPARI